MIPFRVTLKALRSGARQESADKIKRNVLCNVFAFRYKPSRITRISRLLLNCINDTCEWRKVGNKWISFNITWYAMFLLVGTNLHVWLFAEVIWETFMTKGVTQSNNLWIKFSEMWVHVFVFRFQPYVTYRDVLENASILFYTFYLYLLYVISCVISLLYTL